MDAGLGFLGAEVGLRMTPVALDSALPGREPGVVSPDRVSEYIDAYVQAWSRVWKGQQQWILCYAIEWWL